MKLASYKTSQGAGYGVVTDSGIVDLTRRIGRKYPDLRALLALGGLAQARKIAEAAKKADFKAGKVTYLPVIPNPGKIVCVGLNYEEHRMETGRDKTENPALFIRVAESQVAHGQPIIIPAESTNLDFEGEIAVVIGKRGRRISEQDSWKHIAGYACYNDGSIRDWQRKSGGQFTLGKNFDGTGGFGPDIVTPDELPPGAAPLRIMTRVNGEVMQDSNTDDLIFDVPTLVHELSKCMTLDPGDIIITGTPSGVAMARNPQPWLKNGDVCEVEIEKIGILRNVIAQGG